MIVRCEVAAFMSHVGAVWRRPLLSETRCCRWGSGVGVSRARPRAKSYCDRAAFDRNRGRTTATTRWLDAVRTSDVRTFTAGLRVSPRLAAAGLQLLLIDDAKISSLSLKAGARGACGGPSTWVP